MATLQPKVPIDTTTISVIREIDAASNALGLTALVVGAAARNILLENVFQLPAGRATRDVDFAFAIEKWEQFDALKQLLINQHGFSPDKDVAHRLYFTAPSLQHRVPVDLVPFGGIGEPNEEIKWPPGMEIIMNVAGFRDANDSAMRVEVAPGLVVAITALPAIAVLKVFAWVDRGTENSKDAFDLAILMRQYHEAGDEERVFSLPSEVLEGIGYDIELGGAWMLGNDASQLSSSATAARLHLTFSENTNLDRLVVDVSRALKTQRDPEGYARKLLEQFWAGFQQSTRPRTDKNPF